MSSKESLLSLNNPPFLENNFISTLIAKLDIEEDNPPNSGYWIEIGNVIPRTKGSELASCVNYTYVQMYIQQHL